MTRASQSLLRLDDPLPLLAYPHGTLAQQRDRCHELQQLGIERIYSTGATPLGKHQILGMGYSGIVVLAHRHNSDIALKLRRLDAPAPTFCHEAHCLELANQIGVGPQLITWSRNALVMEYIPGDVFFQWVQTGTIQRDKLRMVLRSLLEQSFRLDQIGLDHGGLRCIASHAIVSGDQVTLIDFSNSSLHRRPANLTSLAQGLFLGTKIPQHLTQWFPLPSQAELIQHLRHYKQNPKQVHFEALLSALHLN